MSQITLYRQKRRDGGVHHGLLLNGGNAWEHFAPGEDDTDPVLLWFVDIRAEGQSLPQDPELAREWLLQNARLINKALRGLAKELRAGIDFNALPLQHDVPGAPDGVRIRIVCSAMRRFDSLQMAKLLAQFARRWQTDLRELRPYEPSPR
jgi:hypothetical protein